MKKMNKDMKITDMAAMDMSMLMSIRPIEGRTDLAQVRPRKGVANIQPAYWKKPRHSSNPPPTPLDPISV